MKEKFVINILVNLRSVPIMSVCNVFHITAYVVNMLCSRSRLEANKEM